MRPTKYVEVGRVAYAVNGQAKGKLMAIVDIIDYNRVLVDGPATGVKRQEYRLNQLQLTAFKVKIQHKYPSKCVRQAWKEANVCALWKESQFAKNLLQAEKRKKMTDYDRFRVARLKQRRSQIIKGTLAHFRRVSALRNVAKPKIALAKKEKAFELQKKEALRIKKLGDPEEAAKIKKEKLEKRKLKVKALAAKTAAKKEAYKTKKQEKKLTKLKKSKARRGIEWTEKPPSTKSKHTRTQLLDKYKTDGNGKFIQTYGGKLVRKTEDPMLPVIKKSKGAEKVTPDEKLAMFIWKRGKDARAEIIAKSKLETRLKHWKAKVNTFETKLRKLQKELSGAQENEKAKIQERIQLAQQTKTATEEKIQSNSTKKSELLAKVDAALSKKGKTTSFKKAILDTTLTPRQIGIIETGSLAKPNPTKKFHGCRMYKVKPTRKPSKKLKTATKGKKQTKDAKAVAK